jgi:hypothetical protein
VLLAEQGKQGRPLQCWIAFELRDHPWPILLKRIVAGLPGMGTLELRRKLARLFATIGRCARSSLLVQPPVVERSRGVSLALVALPRYPSS